MPRASPTAGKPTDWCFACSTSTHQYMHLTTEKLKYLHTTWHNKIICVWVCAWRRIEIERTVKFCGIFDVRASRLASFCRRSGVVLAECSYSPATTHSRARKYCNKSALNTTNTSRVHLSCHTNNIAGDKTAFPHPSQSPTPKTDGHATNIRSAHIISSAWDAKFRRHNVMYSERWRAKKVSSCQTRTHGHGTARKYRSSRTPHKHTHVQHYK